MEFKDIRTKIEHHIRTADRHSKYDLFCMLAKQARMFYTGKEQSVVIRNIRKHETEEQKNLRVEVSEPKTPEAISPVSTIYNKVFRVDGAGGVFNPDFPAPEKEELENGLSHFADALSKRQYLEAQQWHFESTDPNAWLAIGRKDKRNEEGSVLEVNSYPIEITSEEAINYYDGSVGDKWLLMLRHGVEFVDEEEKAIERYTFFTAGKTVVYYEYINKSDYLSSDKYTSVTLVVDKEKRKFAVGEFETAGKEFPCMKWGAYRHNAYDDISVKQPAYWGGYYLLRSIMKKSSFKDVSMYVHVYPKMISYDKVCEYEEGDSACRNGKINGRECPSCNGTGSVLHKSELDVTRIKLPDVGDAREIMPIDSFSTYIRPPLETTKFISEDLKEDMKAFLLTVFNSQQEEKVVSSRTATEVLLDTENMNNAVKPFADHNSRLDEFITRLTAQYMELSDKMSYNHSYPKKLGLESVEVITNQIEKAQTLGAGNEIINAYYQKWLTKQYPETPSVANNWLAFQRLKPFSSLNAGVVLNITDLSQSKDLVN